MTREDQKTQAKVGIFLLIGLIVIGSMVVYFGRLGDSVTGSYNLRVEFPNASGLLKGAEVLLAGARVGRVADGPKLLPNMEGVSVNLRIADNVDIPSASTFSIGSSGLLGDKYVQIILKDGAKESAPIPRDSVVKGVYETGGLGGVADSAGELMAELRTAIGNINSVAAKIDSGVLSDEGVRSISETLKNLKTTSEKLAEASANVDKVVAQAGTAIEGGKDTMESAKKAADELQKTLSDIRGLVREVRQGRGALGTLIGNRQVAEDLRALVANLRSHGILWYRDGEKKKSPAPAR